jgi:hypothetical protein
MAVSLSFCVDDLFCHLPEVNTTVLGSSTTITITVTTSCIRQNGLWSFTIFLPLINHPPLMILKTAIHSVLAKHGYVFVAFEIHDGRKQGWPLSAS